MLHIRKTLLFHDTVTSEMGRVADHPIVRAVALAVIDNPFAGRSVEDLTELFEAGRTVGEQLTLDLVAVPGRCRLSSGRGAIVGTAGESAHGAAGGPPMLAKPMRAAVG